MKESLKTRFMRYAFNFFPAYRRTGAWLSYLSSDFKRVELILPLNWKTKNIVGTIFGGSMYAAIDPIYMVMFLKILGKDYIVWDKTCKIDFKKPGKETLRASFVISDELVYEIKNELENKRSITKDFVIHLVDCHDNICASFDKTLYFRKK